MTSSPTGLSTAKLGGFALIGAGALAVVIGATTTFTSGAENSAQAAFPPPPPPPANQVMPPPAVPAPSPQPAPPQGSPSSQQQPLPPAPSSGQPGSGSTGGQQPAAAIMVRVYNNSTITGLAHRAADDLQRAGYLVPEVGNYARGTIPTTTFYYRPGTDEQRQAEQAAARFGARVEPRFPGITDASPGLIAIITNDYKGPVAGQ